MRSEGLARHGEQIPCQHQRPASLRALAFKLTCNPVRQRIARVVAIIDRPATRVCIRHQDTTPLAAAKLLVC